MNVLVAYATHHGSTREIAERIAGVLGDRGLDVNVEPVDRVRDVRRFDAFVVGSALYCGWLKEALDFVQRNKAVLAEAPVWLFSSGPLGSDAVDAQGRDVRETATPKELARLREWIGQREHRVFFGAYDPNAKPVGFLERTFGLVPHNAAILAAGDFRDWAEIEAWANAVGDQLSIERTPDGPSTSYEIRVRVQDELGPTWSAMFSGLSVEPQADGTTLLRGSVQDQAALHGLLGAIRDLGLSIVAAETAAVSGASAQPKSRER